MFTRTGNTDHRAHPPTTLETALLDNRPITMIAQKTASKTWSSYQGLTAYDTPAATHLLPPGCCRWYLLATWTGSPQGSGRNPSVQRPSWRPHCPEQPADTWKGKGVPARPASPAAKRGHQRYKKYICVALWLERKLPSLAHLPHIPRPPWSLQRLPS